MHRYVIQGILWKYFKVKIFYFLLGSLIKVILYVCFTVNYCIYLTFSVSKFNNIGNLHSVRKEMKFSEDSEILHGLVHDTTQSS